MTCRSLSEKNDCFGKARAAMGGISLLGFNSDSRSMELALDPNKNEELGMNGQIGNTAGEFSKTVPGVTRREWFRAAGGGCAGLALGALVDVEAVRASTRKLKL